MAEKSVLKLPKLKTRDELLRTAPELARLFTPSDGDSGGATAPPPRQAAPAKPRPRSPARRAGMPGRLSLKFADEEQTEEERVRNELEKVKAERAAMLGSLARLRADAGKSGGELQQEDVRLLRGELGAKMDKLNELRRANRELTDALGQLERTRLDCEQLMPRGEGGLAGRAQELGAEVARVERDIGEAEAKHELYKLLEVRTGRDHAAAQQRMRDARALREGAAADCAALTRRVHEQRAAKEAAERDLGSAVLTYDLLRGDWSKKLRDRRKEVRELERRRAEDEKRGAELAALAAEKARVERERDDKTRTDREAATRRLSAVVPELDVLEATWARLRGVCGAATAEDLTRYWQDLKAKEGAMRELASLAKERQARALQELTQLTAQQARMSEPEPARREPPQGDERAAAAGQHEQPAAPAAASAPAVEEGAAGLQADEHEAGARSSSQEGAGSPDSADAAQGAPAASSDAKAPAAEEGSAEAPAGQKGAKDPGEQEAPAPSATNAPSAAPTPDGSEAALAPPPASAAAAPLHVAADVGAHAEAGADLDVERALAERRRQVEEARRRRKAAKRGFSKLSQVCFSADQGLRLLAQRLRQAMDDGDRRFTSPHDGLADDRRLSVCSRRVTSGLHRRTTNQTAMRVSAAGLVERRGSLAVLPSAAAVLVPEATQRDARAGGAAGHSQGCFPELPAVALDVASQLDRLGRLMAGLEEAERAAQAADAAAVAAAAARLQRSLTGRSERSSDASVAADDMAEVLPASAASAADPAAEQATPEDSAGQAGAARVASKRLQWADGAGEAPAQAPPAEQEDGGEGREQGGSAADEAAIQGERELRRGFQRRTWAGPAWVNIVAAGKPLTATLRKVAASRRPAGAPGTAGRAVNRAAVQAALKRIAGYVEEPGSDDGGSNPFVLSSSDEEGEEDCVVDRQYLKNRAHKLTNPRARIKAPGASNSSPDTR